MSYKTFSQSLEIKRSTVVKLYKEISKCDSLKIAYTTKSIEIDNLITTNLSIFNQLETERTKRITAEDQLQELNTRIKKEAAKNNNTMLFGVSGITVGLILGILIK